MIDRRFGLGVARLVRFAVVVLVIDAVIIGAFYLVASTAHAQQLDPLAPVQAYTTADPNNPDRLGLAMSNGRYSVTPVQGCDGVEPGLNVAVWPNMYQPPWLPVANVDTGWDTNGQPPCIVRVEGRMDLTPCFTNDAGMCDVSAESDAE